MKGTEKVAGIQPSDEQYSTSVQEEMRRLLATGSASPLTGVATPTCSSPKSHNCIIVCSSTVGSPAPSPLVLGPTKVVPEAARQSRGCSAAAWCVAPGRVQCLGSATIPGILTLARACPRLPPRRSHALHPAQTVFYQSTSLLACFNRVAPSILAPSEYADEPVYSGRHWANLQSINKLHSELTTVVLDEPVIF